MRRSTSQKCILMFEYPRMILLTAREVTVTEGETV